MTAQKFVNVMTELFDKEKPFVSRMVAKQLDPGTIVESMDCHTMTFYHFSDGSCAGVKRARPAAMRHKGARHQAWVVK